MADIFDRLLCKRSVGAWQARRLGLRVELDTLWLRDCAAPGEPVRAEAFAAWSGLAHSLHLLYADGRGRLNIAALDDRRRNESLDQARRGLEIAAALGLGKVVMHTAPRCWDGRTDGDYGRLVDALRLLAAEAARHDILICLENNRVYWDGCDPAVPADRLDLAAGKRYFADAPGDWAALARDVGRDNVRLCLDTSHAVTSAQREASLDARVRVLGEFLDAGELIAHVHWNSNYLADTRGRLDQHLPLHAGSIPLEIHRRVASLPGATFLLERNIDAAAVLAEMAFIRELTG